MHLTVCVVTSNRPEWESWWAWNILKQTRQPDTLVVIDGTPGDDWGSTVVQRSITGSDMSDRIYRRMQGNTVGELRNHALDVVRRYAPQTDVIGWFDDDDWHHPKRLEVLMDEMEYSGADVTFVGNQYRLMLEDLELVLLDEARDAPEISLPFGLFRADVALKVGFPRKNVGEDRAWMDQVLGASGKPPRYVDVWDIPTMCIVHGTNTWNRRDLPEYEMYREFPWCAQPLPLTAPVGIDKAEWAETHRRLKLMQDACGFNKR